jgi:hypothetical protein
LPCLSSFSFLYLIHRGECKGVPSIGMSHFLCFLPGPPWPFTLFYPNTLKSMPLDCPWPNNPCLYKPVFSPPRIPVLIFISLF